ncbi:predicted protein [Naegleria gruberi]|uniref:Predicted protein n=1 Tax=Naegleria gruberi TaxID=5762 RepID=D2V374_NAEGR|nr:uncharacterized protein NAEGRDRAFT_63254 [Naegleria gruberi]EFC48725.1 predicted protein [Naegleria gruberi]|eukprot:XP_002681469.1 predicted protein [Naegleria gruberi strain NEG-M]
MNTNNCFLSGDIISSSTYNNSSLLNKLTLSRTLFIKQVAVGSSKVFLFTSENKLIMLQDVENTDLVKNLPLDDRNVLKIAAGHSFIIMTDKSIFREYKKLELEINPKHVKKLISKFDGTALITHNSELYICENYGKAFKKVSTAKDSKFSHASFGSSHSLILSESGNLYTTGSNTYGQLGIAPMITPTEFIMIDKTIVKSPIKFAECGYFHTIAVTVENEIFGVGWNAVGELGDGSVGDKTEWVKATFSVPNNVQINYLTVGYQQSFVVLSDGTIFCCGFNNYGGLGLGDTQSRSTYEKFKTEHVLDNGVIKVNKPIAGGHFTFYCLDPEFNESKGEKQFKAKIFSQYQSRNNSDIIIECNDE